MLLKPTVHRVSACAKVAILVGMGLACVSSTARTIQAQEQPPASNRQKAMQMMDEHRDLEALPLLELLAKADPNDKVVQERLALALITQSATVRVEKGAELRRRARSILVELKKQGPLSDLSQVLVDGIPENGGVPTFSSKAEVQEAMKEGEAAFARRDFEAARRSYQRALTLDPSTYSAALFVGDCYFAENQLVPARTWFARAILIDPNQEVGHRYLADAQSKAGHSTSALLSYLDAVLAEPYSRAPWVALGRWAKVNKFALAHPSIVPEDLEKDARDRPVAAVTPKAGTADDGQSQWPRYEETRKAWSQGRFQTTFPNEGAYRHSLVEEADALRQVARAIAAEVKAGRIKTPHPSFANLIKLDNEGLLEAYVLYARPDEGIAEDYPAYRTAHRGELRRYLTEFFAPEANLNAGR
jgi:tetratricopeptide (TPR) repeat protein